MGAEGGDGSGTLDGGVWFRGMGGGGGGGDEITREGGGGGDKAVDGGEGDEADREVGGDGAAVHVFGTKIRKNEENKISCEEKDRRPIL